MTALAIMAALSLPEPFTYCFQVYTREYCSPEVARAIVDGSVSMVVEPASDLWGVGVIMYELVTGMQQRLQAASAS